MKLKKAKTCNNCRAAERDYCSLRFKVKVHYSTKWVFLYEMKPLEPCYKPLTYSDFIAARDIIAENNTPSE